MTRPPALRPGDAVPLRVGDDDAKSPVRKCDLLGAEGALSLLPRPLLDQSSRGAHFASIGPPRHLRLVLGTEARRYGGQRYRKPSAVDGLDAAPVLRPAQTAPRSGPRSMPTGEKEIQPSVTPRNRRQRGDEEW
jgi:hypothetical protein